MRRRFALIGDPVAHSLSPAMHSAAFAALGVDATYQAVRTKDYELPEMVQALRHGELDGINVTIPHKRRVLAHVDLVDGSARTVGAANTLARDPNGRVIAYNTDVLAIAAELRALAPDVPLTEGWMKAKTLVLGTGATARSAIIALGHHIGVAEIVVRGRMLEEENKRDAFHAEILELLQRAGAQTIVRLEPWAPIVTTDRDILAVVQTTSLGMDGGDSGEAAAEVIAWEPMFPEALALDVVYSKTPTPFLQAAAAHGVRTADGIGMLVRQGALALEVWLDQPAPVNVMRRALL